jgi:tRNA (mo5U34)-methyltransferase
MVATCLTPSDPNQPLLAAGAHELAPWFHNLHLPDGTQTAPNHPLGDFPRCKWQQIADQIPADLSGWRVLDVGCNAGFYSIELARRGAHVIGIDINPHFLSQATWAVGRFGLSDRVDLLRAGVYDLPAFEGRFDLVLFMGVFYHLRYPQLALDLVAEKVGRMLVFQTLTMPGDEVVDPPVDLGLHERERMQNPGWPKMAFIEHALAGDPTNWWAPNHAAVLALLRSSGLTLASQPGHEIYVCTPAWLDGGQPPSHREELLAATGRSEVPDPGGA